MPFFSKRTKWDVTPFKHYTLQFFVFLNSRDAPEATGDEPDDMDFEAPKIYEPIESMESLRARLLMFMEQYNEAIRGANMDLVFFNDAMIHLVKVSDYSGNLRVGQKVMPLLSYQVHIVDRMN